MLKIGSKVMYREGNKVKRKIEGIIAYLTYHENNLYSIGIFLTNCQSKLAGRHCNFFYNDNKKIIVKELPDEIDTFSIGQLLNTKYGKAIIVSSENDNLRLFLYEKPNSFEPLECLKLYKNIYIEQDKIDLYKSNFNEHIKLMREELEDPINQEEFKKFFNLDQEQDLNLENCIEFEDEDFKYFYNQQNAEDYDDSFDEQFYKSIKKEKYFNKENNCLHLTKDQLQDYLV